MCVESFGLDQRLAMEAEASLASVLGGLLQDALLRSGGSRKDEELAIGEHAIHVEEKEFDFAGTGLSGEFGHWRDFSIRDARRWYSQGFELDCCARSGL